MRKGQNPAKLGIPSYQPQRLGVAILTYIPSQEGYFAEALDILKIQIGSLYRATPGEFDLFVFDNGSCAPVQAELQSLVQAGWVDWLFCSRQNLGKTGALNWILGAMPNELIVYADSDVLFRPDWLKASLKILGAFPEAGMISAQPGFFDVLHGAGRAYLRLSEEAGYRVESRLMPAAVVDEYCRGIGAAAEKVDAFRKAPLPVVIRVSTGVEAVIGATHMQFLVERDFARSLLPLPASRGLATEEDRVLDERVDQAGRLHLSTLEPLVFHMGNSLDESLRPEIQGLDGALKVAVPAQVGVAPENQGWLRLFKALSRFKPFQNRLRRLYNLLFEYYAQQ